MQLQSRYTAGGGIAGKAAMGPMFMVSMRHVMIE